MALLAGRERRSRWLIAALAALSVGVALRFHIGGPAALAERAPWAGALTLSGWALLGALLRAGGGLWMGPNPGLAALCGGALFGDVAAAALLSAGADKRVAARLALTASAGGLFSGVGTPALALSGPRLELIPLGILLAALSWPSGPAPAGGARGVSAGMLLVAALSWWSPPIALLAGLVGAGAQALRRGARPEISWFNLISPLLFAALIAVAARSGALWSAEWGAAWLLARAAAPAAALLSAVASLLSAVGGEAAASLALSQIAAAPLFPRFPELGLVLACGAAVGGVEPLLAAGAWREGRRLWLAQVVAAALYMALLANRWE